MELTATFCRAPVANDRRHWQTVIMNHIRAAAILLLALTGAAPAPSISIVQGARPLALHSGVNMIPDFAGDGRVGMITLGWRDNGNAHGFEQYTVMMPTSKRDRYWNIVGLEHDDPNADFENFIRDDPHTGEDNVTSVRFVRKMFRGRSSILLVVADRHWKESIPEPARTTIEVYALKHNDGANVGATVDYYARIASKTLNTRYCDSDMALHVELGFPLSRDYGGGKTPDGC
jgi:hypothetical protein